MKLANYVANFVAGLTPRVYGLCGAGAMHLNDAICNHPRIKFLPMHHEQAAAMAAEADARVSGKIGVVHVTAGPGGTNTLTGLAGAWVDSIPMLVIAGQVGTNTMLSYTGVRQLGCNELDLVSIVWPITKYAVCVTNPEDIRYALERAVYLATTGRPGPVWVEIPLDVQSAEIEPDKLRRYNLRDFPPSQRKKQLLTECESIGKLLGRAKRPLLLIGNGVRLAGAQASMLQFVKRNRIPVVSSWNASDLIATDNSLYIGRPGVMGDRPGNFAVQNADVVLAVGTRLSIPQIGHATHLFAQNAKLIVVDIDPCEISKPTLTVEIGLAADADVFFRRMNSLSANAAPVEWASRCLAWKDQYPVMQPQYRQEARGINPYFFAEVLSEVLPNDAIVVTDVGTPFQATMQSLRLKGTQRLFHSSGVSAMGYGIPAAIGAYMAGEGRPVVCLTGDGGAMLNMQELQTIAHNDLPIKIFVFANNGYATMRYTQATHFDREAASSPNSGISCAAFTDVARAFGILSLYYAKQDELKAAVSRALSLHRPFLVEMEMPANQLLLPRVQSRMEGGRFIPTPIEDMYPYLPRGEFNANMVERASAA